MLARYLSICPFLCYLVCYTFLLFFLFSVFLFFLFFFFFFQAEDGIRDRDVTGVQTCALPIYPLFLHSPRPCGVLAHIGGARSPARRCRRNSRREAPQSQGLVDRAGSAKIGRASCRERV